MTEKGKWSLYGYKVPFSLDEVARADSLDRPLRFREFLDQFHLADDRSRPSMVASEPCGTGDETWDVHLAATAEHLCLKAGIDVPDWTRKRHLEEPWFAAKSDDMRLILFVQSPPAFRRRNLFVSIDALQRATTPEGWRDDPGFGCVREGPSE